MPGWTQHLLRHHRRGDQRRRHAPARPACPRDRLRDGGDPELGRLADRSPDRTPPTRPPRADGGLRHLRSHGSLRRNCGAARNLDTRGAPDLSRRHSRRYRGMPRCPRRPVSRRESRQARHPAGLRACAKPDNMVSYGKAGRQERMMRGLAGKSVLVTGGGSGIGRAAALLLGEGGCRLLIADLSQDAADRVCAEVIGNGGEARAFHGDVGSEEDVRAMVDAAVSAFGGLQRSEEHTSELQSLMRISYAVFCLKKKIKSTDIDTSLHYNNELDQR